MKIRNNMRIVALVLALVMLLPLISIPAFAEEASTEVNLLENFDSRENVGDALAKWPTSTKLENGALRIEHSAYDSGKFYAMANQNNATEITDATVVDGYLTGKITINGTVYNIEGNVTYTKTKPAAATLVKADDSSAYTGDALYIFSAAACDAWKGGWNVATQAMLKNPEVLPADHTKITVSADYFFSTDINTGKEYEITLGSKVRGATNANGRVDLAKLGTGDGFVYLTWHSDAKTLKDGSRTLRVPMGQWFNFRADLDLTTGNIALFLNNEYAMTVTDTDLPGGVTANSFNLFQISRSSTPNNPEDMKGYVLVDNARFTTENKVYYANSFDQYAGMKYSDLEGGAYQDNFGTTTALPTKLDVVTENGNTYFKYKFGADYVGSRFDADYFAYANYTEWAENKNIASFDADAGVITLKSGTTYTLTKKASAAQIAEGYYGDFTYNGTTYMLTTGPYAAERKFGDGNVDKAISLLIPPLSYEDSPEIYLTAKVFIEPGSKGTSEMQFYKTSAAQYVSMGTINLSSGYLSASGLSLPIGEWATLGIKLDMATGKTTHYVFTADGCVDSKAATDIGDNLVLSFGSTTYRSGEWIIAKHNKTAGAGSISIDDVQILDPSLIPDGKKVLASLNFETQTVGSAPTGFSTLANSGTIVDNSKGSKAWKIDFNNVGSASSGSDSGDLNVDKNSYFTHAALSYQTTPVVVFEADYYFAALPTSGKLYIQSQANGVSVNGASAINWCDLYQIRGENGAYTLMREGGNTHGSAVMPLNRWNTVSAELNLVTGKLNVYINNVLAVDSWLNMADQASRTNMTIQANKWVVGKCNKQLGSATYWMDNFKMYAGNVDAVVKDSEDFEAFKAVVGQSIKGSVLQAPALATFEAIDNNTVLRLPMGAAASADTLCLYNASTKEAPKAGVTYVPGEETATYGGTSYDVSIDTAKDNLPYITMNDAKYYIISSALGETAYGGGNVANALKLFTNKLSYQNAKVAVLEEDLFIEEGSTGVIESQFEAYHVGEEATKGSWVQVFHLYMESGLLTGQDGTNYGVYLNKGEWNNIKIHVNLETGVFTIYANGVLARTYDCGNKNIILDEAWVPVKVQRHNLRPAEVYEGAILVDNVRVSYEDVPVAESQYGASFLTDEAFNAYVEGIVTAVNGASIRLSDPTGLRFASKVDSAKINYLANVAKATVKMATLITPESYLNAAGAFTKEALDAVSVSNAKYLDVEFDGVYFSGDKGFNTDDGDYIVGSIVRILPQNITRKFAGAAYVEITLNDVTYTVYAEAQVRSVREVAAAALADQNVSWSDAQRAVLEGYAY